MTADAIRREILDVWVEVKNSGFPNADRVDVVQQVKRAEMVATSEAEQYRYLWLTLTDESLHFFLLLHRFVEENVEKVSEERGRSAVAFRSLVVRMCALTVAVRRLVVTGLEDAARSVMRSWLETLDLAIVVLADDEFARRYSAEVDYDANEFWKAEIGYGRLNKRLNLVLDKAQMTPEQKERSLGNRKLVKNKLSESVHSSLPSAMFSEVIPSISSPGFYNRSILGHISATSPNLLSLIVENAYEFGVIFHKLLTSSDPPPLLNNIKSVVDCSNLHAAFFTLQEMVERYSEVLPPPSDPSDTGADN